MIYCNKQNEKVCLPDILECENKVDIQNYMDKLYKIFTDDYLISRPIFKGKKVFIRKEPRDGNKEHTFIHLTHEDFFHKSGDPNDRVPDFRRSERLSWTRKIIENYKCSVDNECEKILYWEELFRGYKRINLLYKDERFLVVLEERDYCYLLITSFYLEKDYALDKRIKKYELYEKQKTPLM